MTTLKTWQERWQLGHRGKEPYLEKLKKINWKIKQLQKELEKRPQDKETINVKIDAHLEERWATEGEIESIDKGIETARKEILKRGGQLPNKHPKQIKPKKEYKKKKERKGNTREITEQPPGMPKAFYEFCRKEK